MIKKNVVLRIFEECDFREGEPINRGITSGDCILSDFVKVKDHEKLSKAIFEFLISKDGEGTSQRWLLMNIRLTLIQCDKESIFDINKRVDLFFENLEDMRKVNNHVVKAFHGAMIKEDSEPVKIGPFFIFELPRHKEQYIAQLPDFDFLGRRHMRTIKTVIQYIAETRDPEKALEIANFAFNSFEMFIAFLLEEKHSLYSIGILRMRFSPFQYSTIYSDHGSFSGDGNDKKINYDLDVSTLSTYLPDEIGCFFDELVHIIFHSNSDLEKRISTAIEWLGESYSDNNISSAYLKTVIALEALLKSDEKSIITPSIMSSIAEQCAYINGRTAKECMEIEKEVKNFYGLRSKITHTGSKTVSMQQLKVARSFVRRTILNLFHFIQIEKIRNICHLNDVLREIKYKNVSRISEVINKGF